MVASLVRLLHSGPQDQRLLPKLGPKDVSAYVRVYVRVGRMTTQWQRLDFQQVPSLGNTATCRLPVYGELITRLYLVTTMPDIYTSQAAAIAATPAGKEFAGPRFGWTNSLGHALFQSATIDIGGTRIDSLDGRLLEVHDEFDTPLEKIINTNTLIKRSQNGFTQTTYGNTAQPTQVVTPLPFWFSKGDLGSALPIDAIHVDEVRVSITFRPVTSLYFTSTQVILPDSITGQFSPSQMTNVEGAALFPIANSPFYYYDNTGQVVANFDGTVLPIEGVQMPDRFPLGDTYLMAEYVYLDRPEANRFRISEILLPITQHYSLEPVDTKGFPQVRIPMQVQNPVRHIYFMANRYEAAAYNAFFLATRDLGNIAILDVPWWPNAQGLNASIAAPLVPAFSQVDSEPLSFIELVYEGNFVRVSTENCALYRSIIPSLEERKSPWHNRYMYTIPMGLQSGYFDGSTPLGYANFNRIMKKELLLGFRNGKAIAVPPRYIIYGWLETFNILRVFGGRAAMLFAY